MDKTKLYKILGMALKLGIIIFAFAFIFKEIFFKKDLRVIYDFFLSISNNENTFIFIGVVLLMFLNWTLEVVKWRFLIKHIEKIGFNDSLIGVFSGITVGTFTPNRIGEYAGRVFVLKPENRWKGVVLTLVGSIAQLLTTIIMGLIAFLFFYPAFEFAELLQPLLLIIAIISILILILFYFNVGILLFFIKKIKKLHKIIKYVSVLGEIKRVGLFIILLLSLMRYLVFSFQFYILLRLCGLDITVFQSFMTTSIIYFILAAIPTIALSEFGVRGTVALFIFGLFYKHSNVNMELINIGVVSAAFFLWLVNLALPALIGAVFVFKLKFFKH